MQAIRKVIRFLVALFVIQPQSDVPIKVNGVKLFSRPKELVIILPGFRRAEFLTRRGKYLSARVVAMANGFVWLSRRGGPLFRRRLIS